MRRTSACLLLIGLGGGCSDDPPPPPYGPFWQGTAVTPRFDVKQNSLSTSFTGRVFPVVHFELGDADGVTFDKPYARLTINANEVWQHAPLVVELYDGAIGDVSARVARWQSDPPPLGGAIALVESVPLGVRPASAAVVDFGDFAGNTILEVLGHD